MEILGVFVLTVLADSVLQWACLASMLGVVLGVLALGVWLFVRWRRS